MLRTAFTRSPLLRGNALRFSSNYVVLGSSSALKDIIAKDGSKILYFTATWCPPCKKIAPAFEKMSKDFANTTFVKIDIDDHRDLAEQYNISSVPTFKAVSGSTVTSSVRWLTFPCRYF
jgi:thioredoxin 1